MSKRSFDGVSVKNILLFIFVLFISPSFFRGETTYSMLFCYFCITLRRGNMECLGKFFVQRPFSKIILKVKV